MKNFNSENDIFKNGTLAPVELAPGYELGYFEKVIQHALNHYVDLLDQRDLNFIRNYNSLSNDLKIIILKLNQRIGPLFVWNRLKYAAVCLDSLGNLNKLCELRLIQTMENQNKEEIDAVLDLFTKVDLLNCFPEELRKYRNKKKSEIELAVTHFFENSLFELWIKIKVYLGPIVKIEDNTQRVFKKLLCLFFGNVHQTLTDFVLKDLSINRFESYTVDVSTRYFQKLSDVESKIKAYEFWDTLVDKLNNEMNDEQNEIQNASAESLTQLIIQSRHLISTCEFIAHRRLFKCLHLIAMSCYRLKYFELGVEALQGCTLGKSQLLLAKCFAKLGAKEEAESVCYDIIQRFDEFEAVEYALKYLAKEKFCVEVLSTQLKMVVEEMSFLFLNKKHDAPWRQKEIEVLKSNLNVEKSAADFLCATNGGKAFHVENSLWLSLFGCVFWDSIFMPKAGVFLHEFQFGPLDSFTQQFYKGRQEVIDQRLSDIESGKWWIKELKLLWNLKFGTSNYFVTFVPEVLEALELLLQYSQPTMIVKILKTMLNFPEFSSKGFCDLLYVNCYRLEFWEVKSKSDELRSHQKFWLKKLNEAGYSSGVLHVKFLNG